MTLELAVLITLSIILAGVFLARFFDWVLITGLVMLFIWTVFTVGVMNVGVESWLLGS